MTDTVNTPAAKTEGPLSPEQTNQKRASAAAARGNINP
jgi:hypothetical protein